MTMNMMLTPKIMEAWFSLLTDAMRGSSDAQQLIKMLSSTSTVSDETMRMMMRFMPPGMTSMQPEAMTEWLEEWWRMMGVVPRHRYLELLERYEVLRSRLEESERTSRRLQSMLGEKRQEEAQKVLDLWGSTLEETLKTQSDWMRLWMPSYGASSTGSEEEKTSSEPEASRENKPKTKE